MGQAAKTRWLLRAALSFACAAVFAGLIWTEYDDYLLSGWLYLFYIQTGILVLGLLASLGIGFVCLDICNLNPADDLSTAVIRSLYFNHRRNAWKGPKALADYKATFEFIQSQQAKLLQFLVKSRQNTAYGRDHNFSSINTLAQFRKSHKLTTYDDYKAYVDRICDGEQNVLSSEKILCIAKTSGTTGKPKLFPYVLGFMLPQYSDIFNIFYYYPMLKRAKPRLMWEMQLGHKPHIDISKSGLPIGPLTYFLKNISVFNASPKIVSEIPHESTAMYVHSLFALKQKEIGRMLMMFAHQVYCFFTFMEENIKLLCKDIENGTLSYSNLELDEDIKAQILKELHPDKRRSDEIRMEFSKGKVGLALRIWPYLGHIYMTETGSMEPYGRVLRQTYLKDVTIVANAYGGSEGVYGLNLSSIQNDPTYHLSYPSCFFEFIPEEELDKSQPDTLLAHELKVGERYEIVVTTLTLTRYRVGDVIKVVKYDQQCPVFEFQYRSGQILNILGEKTPENVFYEAVKLATERLGVTLYDYTTCEDICLYGVKVIDGYVRHYVLFIELDKQVPDADLIQFDESLCDLSEVYKYMRTNRQSVAMVEVIQVKPHTFLQLKDMMVKSTRNPQYKLPRALRNKDYLDFLLSNKM